MKSHKNVMNGQWKCTSYIDTDIFRQIKTPSPTFQMNHFLLLVLFSEKNEAIGPKEYN